MVVVVFFTSTDCSRSIRFILFLNYYYYYYFTSITNKIMYLINDKKIHTDIFAI